MGLNIRIISYYIQLNGIKLLRERLSVIGRNLSTQLAELLRVTTNSTLQECGDVVYWDNPIPAHTWAILQL